MTTIQKTEKLKNYIINILLKHGFVAFGDVIFTLNFVLDNEICEYMNCVRVINVNEAIQIRKSILEDDFVEYNFSEQKFNPNLPLYLRLDVILPT